MDVTQQTQAHARNYRAAALQPHSRFRQPEKKKQTCRSNFLLEHQAHPPPILSGIRTEALPQSSYGTCAKFSKRSGRRGSSALQGRIHLHSLKGRYYRIWKASRNKVCWSGALESLPATRGIDCYDCDTSLRRHLDAARICGNEASEGFDGYLNDGGPLFCWLK